MILLLCRGVCIPTFICFAANIHCKRIPNSSLILEVIAQSEARNKYC